MRSRPAIRAIGTKMIPVFSMRFAIAAIGLVASANNHAVAMAPMLRPTSDATIAAGRAEPFAGSWSVSLPTRDATAPSTDLAICTLPVRIKAVNQTHIFYLGPRETEADAAIELIARDGGTAWEPIAGGPAFFSIWVTPHSFYLYDAASEG